MLNGAVRTQVLSEHYPNATKHNRNAIFGKYVYAKPFVSLGPVNGTFIGLQAWTDTVKLVIERLNVW